MQRASSLAVVLFWSALLGSAFHGDNRLSAAQQKDNCVLCHSKLKDRAGQVVAIFNTSTHAHSGVSCDGCHGGDSSQTEKNSAHANHFVARPDTAATLEMCGQCHRQPLEFFKGSRHVAARPNAARLDCVECHGVHSIGAASESFRWPQFCAGCHGLEYLPQLPKPFQEMLALADDLREGIHRLDGKANGPPKELVERRKELRHMISQLVHPTDLKGGAERIPRILELGASLKQQLDAASR